MSKSLSEITIKLDSFSVENSRLNIKWSISEDFTDNCFKLRNLWVEYFDVFDINPADVEIMFIALVAGTYALKNKDVSFCVYINHASDRKAEQVIEFLDVNNVIFFRHDCIENKPAHSSKYSPKKKYALFYGGGKDSLLSAAMHSEIYGHGSTTLIRLVWDENENNLTSKKEIFRSVSNFLVDKGFSFKYIMSNFHSTVSDRETGKLLNFALYPFLSLPLLSFESFSQISFGYDAGHFHKPINSKRKVPFKLCRPEYLKKLQTAISMENSNHVKIKNFNYGINASVAFELICKRYPEYFSTMYMCERLSGKWCLKCRKCFFYALGCLSYKMTSEFNLAYFFQKSSYVKNVLLEISDLSCHYKKGDEAAYSKYFAYPTHTCSMLNMVSKVDLNYAFDTLNQYDEAFDNFLKIYSWSKKFDYSEHGTYWLKAYDQDADILNNDDDAEVRNKILRIMLQENIPISDKAVFKGMNKDSVVTYDFSWIS